MSFLYSNIVSLASRADELINFIDSCAAKNEHLSAILLAEPCISLASTPPLIHPEYTLTEPNIAHESSHNAHLDTAAIFHHHSDTHTVTELNCTDAHKGVTWLQVHSSSPAQPHIAIGVAYFPTASSDTPLSYRTSLLRTWISNMDELKAKGFAIMVVGDFNCNFTAPHIPAPARHNLNVYQAMLDSGLSPINWKPGTNGFHTRARGGSRSCLDLLLVSADLYNKVSLTIDDSTTFDSDHFSLLFTLQVTAQTKATQISSELREYTWTPLTASRYYEITDPLLPAWNVSAQDFLDNIPPDPSIRRSKIAEITENITNIILQSYSTAFPPKITLFTYGTPLKRWPDTIAKNLVQTRDSAKVILEALRHGNLLANSPQVCFALAAYTAASIAVGKHFANTKATRDNKIYGQMEAAFDDDKASLFNLFKKNITPPRLPLPSTLMSSRGEIRDPTTIQETWVHRFEIHPENRGGAEERAFRKTISEHVAQMRKQIEPDHLQRKQFFSQTQTESLIAELLRGKSPGVDTILAEMLKRGSPLLKQAINLLMNLLYAAEQVSQTWKMAIYIPAYKRACRLWPLHYRPIGLLSVLYKLYESHTLIFALGSIYMIPEQCGARKGYSSHTLLKRLQILVQLAKVGKWNLFLAAIDVKEAYERVWRTGILYRLWEAGIRGKLWRVIDDMLSNTYSAVKTNFGLTKRFRTKVGIIQGAVLSALLFCVFFNPISIACTPLSPTISDALGDFLIRLMMYMDDGTIAATSELQRHNIVLRVLQWADRWNTTISIDKSVYASFINSLEARRFEASLFKEVEKVKIVGLTLFKDGLNPPPALKAIMARAASKARSLLAPTRGIPLRFDVIAFLYDKFCFSILSHSRPFIQAGSSNCANLQLAQDTFALDALQLSPSTSPLLAASELGIYDMDLVCAKDALLLHHRLANNVSDQITIRLLSCPITEAKQDSHALAQLDLSLLGIHLPIALLLRHHYLPFKQLIKASLHSTQQSRYSSSLLIIHPTFQFLRLAKPYWGMDHTILKLKSQDAITFLHFRLHNFRPATVSPSNMGCKFCMSPLSSIHHALWICPDADPFRTSFLAKLLSAHPTIWTLIQTFDPLQPQQLSTFFLGGARSTIASIQWTPPLLLFVEYLTLIKKKNLPEYP